ncbi:MAG: hypothetical protein HY716_02370 [Planctomycetes bacterium]|nr:hypothetical protein [Planctomycetota bacterium]
MQATLISGLAIGALAVNASMAAAPAEGAARVSRRADRPSPASGSAC